MLKFKKITFCNVGRYTEEQTIAWDAMGNLVQVSGLNKNTGGSSGASKTTIFNVTEWLLGTNDIPTSVLQSRLTKNAMYAIGEFDYNGIPLIIKREKKGLHIDLGGEIIEGSSKLAEEKLDQIIGMPRDLFRKILHKRQKEGGFFLDFTPKKMYEFLSDCLGLNEISKKMEILDNKMKSLVSTKLEKENALISLNASLSSTEDSIVALGSRPEKNIDAEILEKLKNKYEETLLNVQTIKSKHKIELEELDLKRPKLIPSPELESVPSMSQPQLIEFNRDSSVLEGLDTLYKEVLSNIDHIKNEESNRIKLISSEIQNIKMELLNLNHSISRSSSAKSEAASIANEIKKIRSSVCPTCDQPWLHESSKEKEKDLINKLLVLKKLVEEGELAQKYAEEKNSNMEKLKANLLPLNEDLLKNKENELLDIQNKIKKEKENIENKRKEVDLKNKEIIHRHRENYSVIVNEIASRNKKVLEEVDNKNKSATESFYMLAQSLKDKQEKELASIAGQLDVDNKNYTNAKNVLDSWIESNSRYEKTFNHLNAKKQEIMKDLSLQTTYLNDTLKEMDIVEELKKALKTYLSYSFDDALDSISDTATKIVRNIPNMSNATIQFEGEKETQEGKIKQEVTAILSVDGELGVPIRSLSGGERTALDLAIDMAVIEFIESETGTGIDIMFLDEPFSGLETVNIEMVIEMLRSSNTNRRLVVVDHNPIINEMIEDKIVAVREGNYSTIKDGTHE